MKPSEKFLRFVLVGGLGFLVDAGATTLLVPAIGFLLGRIAAFGIAVPVTWWLNRTFTFRASGALAPQLVRYVLATSIGTGLNLGIYGACVALFAVCRAHPASAVAAGSATALGWNFVVSNALIFNARSREAVPSGEASGTAQPGVS